MTFVVSSVTRCNDSTLATWSASGGSSPRAGTIEGDEPFPPAFLAALRRLVPCDSVAFCELDRIDERELGVVSYPLACRGGRRRRARLLGGAPRAPDLPVPRGDRRLARVPALRLRRDATFPLEPDLRRVVPAPARREPDHGRPRRAALPHEGLPPRAERRPRLRRLRLHRPRRPAPVPRDAVRGGRTRLTVVRGRVQRPDHPRARDPGTRRRGKDERRDRGELWIACGTVRRHLENAYAKLGVHTRTAAVRAASLG